MPPIKARRIMLLAQVGASLLVVFIPAWRAGPVGVALLALLVLSSVGETRRLWREGWLTQTPSQVLKRIKAGPGSTGTNHRGALETLAGVLSVVALALIVLG